MDIRDSVAEESDGTGVEIERGREGVHRGSANARQALSGRMDTEAA